MSKKKNQCTCSPIPFKDFECKEPLPRTEKMTVKIDSDGNVYDEYDNYLGKGVFKDGTLQVTKTPITTK